MKIKIKRILILLISIMMVLSFFYNVLATGVDITADGIKNKFTGELKVKEGSNADTTIKTALQIILEVVRNVGVGIALIILMVIACKYMLASAGERADIKQNLINYVIGAMVLFGATGIISILLNFVKGLSGTK